MAAEQISREQAREFFFNRLQHEARAEGHPLTELELKFLDLSSIESDDESDRIADEFYTDHDLGDEDEFEERITRLINAALAEESISDPQAKKTYKAMLVALAQFRKDDALVDFLRKAIPIRIPERDGPTRLERFASNLVTILLIGLLCLAFLSIVLGIVLYAWRHG
jgi:hypothetical protein